MGTAAATPELRAIVDKLSAEYKLPFEHRDLKRVRWGGAKKSGEEKENELVQALKDIGPGTWIIVEHPAVDSPESRSLRHIGYENVGEDRAGVLRALTSPRVKDVVKERRIKLISYKDLP